MRFYCFWLMLATNCISLDPIQAFLPLRQNIARPLIPSSKTLRMAFVEPPSLPLVSGNAPTIMKQQKHQSPSNDAFGATDIRYSDFLKLVNSNRVAKAAFSSDGTKMLGIDVDGNRVLIQALPNDPDLIPLLTQHRVDVAILPASATSSGAHGGIFQFLQGLLLPAAMLAGLLFFLSRRSDNVGGINSAMMFGKHKANMQLVPDTGVTFADVAGCDGAKMELMEVVDFLKQPDAYTKNGCKIPRGVILDGPPGTGKTLLAKAIAGEAGVPFLSMSGSEFVEMFVGVGASRVRDLFAQAKKNAPCIIFIDEIDAVGRQRGAGYAGGNDEREQTVNQILVELDGFEGNPGVITIAATNRIDILDKALLRPGRFDRKVTVDLPDFRGRTCILAVHSRGKPLEPDVDLAAIARRTPGFSGASLENLMNEAAISAARKNKLTIGWEEIDSAADRIMIGLEKKGGNPQLSHKRLVAYHEAGHAIVGALVPDYDQVQKISIIPHSNGAGGITMFAPQESRLESGMYSKHYLESQLAVALGGRLAEEIVYGEDMVTTGAANDIQEVANIAKRMVKEWGMSNKIGLVTVSDVKHPSFWGMRMLRRPTHWGNKIMYIVEQEVERLVNNSYMLAKKILNDNRPLLEHVTNTLMEQEVVSAEEFQMMLVEFKAQTIEFAILGTESNRESLPFQAMPTAF